MRITLPPKRIESPLSWGRHVKLLLRWPKIRALCIPHSITFFPNGMVCVGNIRGQQMPKYQIGRSRDAIMALRADGYDWSTLPDVWGRP